LVSLDKAVDNAVSGLPACDDAFILEDDPPDLIVEKVNRTVEELLGAAPERAGFSVEPQSGGSLAVSPNG
jgi:hypothetical protein